MNGERIYSKRLYVVAIPQGISGFRMPAVPGIVTGARLRRDCLRPWCGDRRVVVSAETFRMDDGHLPDFQPRGGIDAVSSFLALNPYSQAVVV